MSSTLSNKALLVVLNISQWTGRRHDRQATETVENAHKSERNVGNYTKKLLPGAKELEEIQRLSSYLRQFFYQETLPWYTDGSRILSSKNYLDFTQAFKKKKSEFDEAVKNFLEVYPVLKEEARAKLGDLYRDSEYPSQIYLKAAFSCEISFLPIPDIQDFRVDILEDERHAFERRMKETESNALKEIWNRLHDTVFNAAQRLQRPEARLRESLVENIKQVCLVLPKLNFADDPKLEQMRQEVEKVVASIDISDCKDSISTRQQAAQDLESVMNKMYAFMGQ